MRAAGLGLEVRVRAGTPPTTAPGSTSRITTALAPMFAPAPTVTGPSTFAPVPMRTSGPIVGPVNSPSTRPMVTNGRMRTPGCTSA